MCFRLPGRLLATITALGLNAIFPGLTPVVHAETTSSQPNIILVFIDDMGWADFSCFGNKDARTPAVDQLAAEGIAFEQFYVNSPICSPSRVAISTGQYPQRWGITSYLAHREGNKKRGLAQWLDPKAPMLARELQKVGYATGHFGKWHMGGQRDVDDAPEISAYGFDTSLTNFEGMGAKLLPETARPGDDGKIVEGRIWKDAERLGEPVIWMQRSEITGGFVDAALKFIDTSVDAGKPFYLNLWPDDVHTPLYPPLEHWANDKRGLYHAVLEAMDRQLAPLFDRIRDDAPLRENTLILVCSDNGPEKDAGRATPFKGYKTHLYEGGIRSPLVAWAPGLMKTGSAGSRNTESVFVAMDLVPSLIRLAGGKESDDDRFDGEDVLDTLLGKGKQSRSTPLFFSRPPDRKSFYGFENLPDLAVRDGRWKLLCDFDGSGGHLYDLSKDPGETKNLIEDHPEQAAKLTSAVTAWYAGVLDSNR